MTDQTNEQRARELIEGAMTEWQHDPTLRDVHSVLDKRILHALDAAEQRGAVHERELWLGRKRAIRQRQERVP